MNGETNIALVPVNGDLDVTTTPALRRTIDRLVRSGCKRIILNMADAEYIDSAGIGLVLGETRLIHERGGLLSLTNVCERVFRSLSLARIVDFVPVSVAGPRPSVPRLEASAQPLWQTSLRIDPDDLHETRGSVERLLSRMGLSQDAVFDLTLATGEAIGNAVDHGEGCSVVTVSCYPDRAIVDVTDCGCGFELGECELPEASADGERGRGIALMRLLADSVTIERKPSGTGTLVRIVKLLNG